MSRTTNASGQALVFLEILKRIPRQRWIDANELLESLRYSGINIEKLTLQRALKTIREHEDFGIECDQRSKPYGYRSLIRSTFEGMKPSAGECLVLRLVEEHLKSILPFNIRRGLEPLFDLARSESNESHCQDEKGWFNKVAVISNGLTFEPAVVSNHVLEAVSQALFRNVKLKITYQNAQQLLREATVSPLGLVRQEVRLYLVCQFEGYDNIRHLALHRFKSAEVLSVPVVRPVDFSLKRYIRSKAFNYTDDDPKKIQLEVDIKSKATVINLTETPLNRTQTITELDNGQWHLSVQIDDSFLLDAWLKTWEEVAGLTNIVKRAI